MPRLFTPPTLTSRISHRICTNYASGPGRPWGSSFSICSILTTPLQVTNTPDDFCLFSFYLNSETHTAQLHEMVNLVQTQPVVVVACRRTKSVTICRPVLVERHRTSSDLPLHQDPTVDGQQRHGDSRVGTQSSSGRLLVRGFQI